MVFYEEQHGKEKLISTHVRVNCNFVVHTVICE